MRAIFQEIEAEVTKARRKFPLWPDDPLHAVGVIAEELGELQQATLECCYEPGKSALLDVRKEALQTAAMCIRFLVSFDACSYRFSEGTQHRQDGGPIPTNP